LPPIPAQKPGRGREAYERIEARLATRPEEIRFIPLTLGFKEDPCPAISPYREFATAGGLMSYGSDRIAHEHVTLGLGYVWQRSEFFHLVAQRALSSFRRVVDLLAGGVQFNIRLWHKADMPSCTANVR
jgi:hypothetical protein